MNQKQLTEAIRDGMTQNRNILIGEINYALLWALVIILLFSILLFSWSEYNEWRFEKEHCDGQPCQVSIGMQSCFPLESLSCEVLVGNESDTFWSTGFFTVCGYEEANAKFEQMKPRIQLEVRSDNELYNRNLEIKYMECN